MNASATQGDAPAAPPGPKFNFAEHLIGINRGRADKIAYIDDRDHLSYGELEAGIRRFAAALLASGVHREERILLLSHDRIEWPIGFLGALYAGIVPVAVNTLLTANNYVYMLEHSRARLAVVAAELLPTREVAMRAARHAVQTTVVIGDAGIAATQTVAFADFVAGSPPLPAAAGTGRDDPGFWLYSSGSTGAPKGAVHTHANPYWTAELCGKAVLGIDEHDVCFSAAKLFFAYGLGNALSFPLSVGATAVLMAGRATPDAVFRRWLEHRPTVFFGAPTGYAAMLASPGLPAREQVSLRLCCSAGEALPAGLGRRFAERFGIDVCDGIGSTEMLHHYLSNTPGRIRYGTSGWPVPGYDIELRDDARRPVADGEIGELYVRGPSAALGYWGNREQSRDTFLGEWTRSGDTFLRNEDGSYSCVGRSDDLFKVSGMYVSPLEVEGTLVEHPAVLEAAVVGLPDADGLIKSKAFVVLEPGRTANEAELKAFVKARLAPYKYPRAIAFVDALPKTATGKVMRYRLREAAAPVP